MGGSLDPHLHCTGSRPQTSTQPGALRRTKNPDLQSSNNLHSQPESPARHGAIIPWAAGFQSDVSRLPPRFPAHSPAHRLGEPPTDLPCTVLY